MIIMMITINRFTAQNVTEGAILNAYTLPHTGTRTHKCTHYTQVTTRDNTHTSTHYTQVTTRDNTAQVPAHTSALTNLSYNKR